MEEGADSDDGCCTTYAFHACSTCQADVWMEDSAGYGVTFWGFIGLPVLCTFLLWLLWFVCGVIVLSILIGGAAIVLVVWLCSLYCDRV
jgi:Flp pilus assembly protein TadB